MIPMWAFLFLFIIGESESKLQAYGCDEGWTNLKNYCYKVVPMEGNATRAQSVCNNSGANIASIWSPEEKKFLLSLWQYSTEFMWLGLSVNPDGDWQWEDGSKLVVEQETGGTWSVLDDTPPDLTSPVSGNCTALSPSGDLNFPNCSVIGTTVAVACKHALRKVYAWSSLLNHSSPAVTGALNTAQMFERVLPPVLSTLPSTTVTALAERVVPMDTSCAFACYSKPSCQAFELSCRAVDNCRSHLCVLLPGVAISPLD